MLMLIATFSLTFVSCGGEDDDEPVDVKLQLTESSKKFVNYWSDYKDYYNGTEIAFFSDGKCWVFHEKDNREVCNWTYDDKTKILATTSVNDFQWNITLSTDESWAGIALNGDGAKSYKTKKYKHLWTHILGNFTGYGDKNDSPYKLYFNMADDYSVICPVIWNQNNKEDYCVDGVGSRLEYITITALGKEGVFKCDFIGYCYVANNTKHTQGEKFKIGSGEMHILEDGNRIKFTGALEFDFKVRPTNYK